MVEMIPFYLIFPNVVGFLGAKHKQLFIQYDVSNVTETFLFLRQYTCICKHSKTLTLNRTLTHTSHSKSV